MKLNSYAICAPGFIRIENQDNLYINGIFRENITDNSDFAHANKSDNNGLYAVADGMGGEKFGELAALVTVQEMKNIKFSDENQGMAEYLIKRNTAICNLIKENNGSRIGSTFAGLYINKGDADIVNIGDSRVYLFRDWELTQLSQDHTITQQMINIGVLTKEAAATRSDRHKLTQHLGIFPHEMVIEPYFTKTDVKTGDIFLLCSDGLTDMLSDINIKDILIGSASIKTKAESLYAEALEKGGKDNITIILVEVKKKGLFK